MSLSLLKVLLKITPLSVHRCISNCDCYQNLVKSYSFPPLNPDRLYINNNPTPPPKRDDLGTSWTSPLVATMADNKSDLLAVLQLLKKYNLKASEYLQQQCLF